MACDVRFGDFLRNYKREVDKESIRPSLQLLGDFLNLDIILFEDDIEDSAASERLTFRKGDKFIILEVCGQHIDEAWLEIRDDLSNLSSGGGGIEGE